MTNQTRSLEAEGDRSQGSLDQCWASTDRNPLPTAIAAKSYGL